MNARLLLPLLLATSALATAYAAPTGAFGGRVFFSAAERRALEAPPPPPPGKAEKPGETAPPPRRYDGALWRDGRLVALWFDGQAAKPANAPAVALRDGVPVTTRGGRAKPLWPGQTLPPDGQGGER